MPYANYLQDIGYTGLALPRHNVAPLDLLYMGDETWKRVARLDQVVAPGPGSALPEVTSGESARIGGTITRTMEAGFAAKLLTGILKLFGAKAGAEVKVSGVKEADVSFESVTLDEIAWPELDLYLGSGAVNTGARNMMIALNDDEFAVVTAVLRSPRMSITAGRKSEGSVSVDVPDVGGTVEAGVDVSRSSSSSSEVTFAAKDGGPGIAFGFQALQLNYEGNVFHTWKDLSAGKQLRGPEGAPAPEAARELAQVPTQDASLEVEDVGLEELAGAAAR